MSCTIEHINALDARINVLVAQGRCSVALPLAHELSDLIELQLGARHTLYGQSLNKLSVVYQELGELGRAQQTVSKAMLVFEGIGETESDSFSSVLHNYGVVSQTIGDLALAERLLSKCLDLRKRLHGDIYPEVASTLEAFGHLETARGNHTVAVAHLRDALGILKACVDDNDPRVTTCLNNLAESYYDLGDYDGARSLHQECLNNRRRTIGERHPLFAVSLNNLAASHLAFGDLVSAEPLYQEALNIRRDILGARHPAYAESLNNCGVMQWRLGNYARAEQLYRQAIEIRAEILGRKHPDYAVSVNNLAVLLEAKGEYRDAEARYKEALMIRIAAFGNDHPDVAQGKANLSGFFAKLGNNAEAERLANEAVSIRQAFLGEVHPDYAHSISLLASLSARKGDVRTAETLYKRALEIRSTSREADRSEIAIAQNNLAGFYRELGRLTEAESLYRETLQLRRACVGPTHPDYARSLNNLATVLRACGTFPEAESLLRESLGIFASRDGNFLPEYLGAQENLAGVLTARGLADDAYRLFQEAAASQDRLIQEMFAIASDGQRLDYLDHIRGSFDAYLSLVVGKFAENMDVAATTYDLVMRRKGIATEASFAQREPVLRNKYPQLEEKLKTLRALRVQIANALLKGGPDNSGTSFEQTIRRWRLEETRLESDLAKDIPELEQSRRLSTADHHAISSRLPDRSVLVEYVRFRFYNFEAVPARGQAEWESPRYLVFVLSSGANGRVRMFDLGDASRIDEMIAGFRREILNRHRLPFGRDLDFMAVEADQLPAFGAGATLRRVVFDPIVQVLNGSHQIIVAPDGELSLLPFETLPGDNGEVLLDKYRFRYIAVGRDLLREKQTLAKSTYSPVVLADPNFDLGMTTNVSQNVPQPASKLGVQFRPLPKSRIEGDYVSAILRVSPMLGDNASKSDLVQSKQPCVLHIATHGFFFQRGEDASRTRSTRRFHDSTSDRDVGRFSQVLQESPLFRSGLALAGANTWLQQENCQIHSQVGLLTAAEVLGMDLLGTRLVVLSACDSGVGETRVGEGVFGLRRSFILAGASTIVMSLWKVPDKQTQELMEQFYGRLVQGMHIDEALLEAKQEIRRRYNDPYCWGAFICQGSPDAIGPFPSQWEQQLATSNLLVKASAPTERVIAPTFEIAELKRIDVLFAEYVRHNENVCRPSEAAEQLRAFAKSLTKPDCELFERGANHGYSAAMCLIGAALIEGWGVRTEKERGADWFRKAADRGNAFAQHTIAGWYERGVRDFGIQQDNQHAEEWYQLAVEQEYPRSIAALGNLFFQNESRQGEGFRLILQAAKMGVWSAMFNLGLCYEHGHYVQRNRREAIKWYRALARNGHAKAREKTRTLTTWWDWIWPAT